VVLVVHREQVEQRLEAPLVEVLEVPLAEVPEEQPELEALQVPVELLLRVRLEQSLEQFLL
jgi:hypothetical protein